MTTMISPIAWEEAKFAMTMYRHSLAHSLRRINAMDHQTFDRMTRLFGTAGSRRTAWRALLAGALLGATPRRLAAAPTTPCTEGKHELCGVGNALGNACCPGKCFADECTGYELCCTAEHNLIVCQDAESGKAICCQNRGDDPCRACSRPIPKDEDPTLCHEGIAGSYRRR